MNDAVGYGPSNIDFIRYFKQMILIWPSDVLYDIGCGKGLYVFTLAPFVAESIGIDHNPKMIRDAKRNLISYSEGHYGEFATRVHFYESDVLDFDLSNGTYFIYTGRLGRSRSTLWRIIYGPI